MSTIQPLSTRPSGTREALVEAGLALLAEDGSSGLTLRRAAARAGVSHAAPAHHFDGLQGLQTAIATRAFAQFTRTMTEARDAAGPEPFVRLLGLCEGYLAFARNRSGLFHLMFVEPAIRRDDPDLMREAKAAYGLLAENCAPFAQGDPQTVEAAVWSLVHGYAMLGLDLPVAAGRPFSQQPAFPLLLKAVVGRV
ncbi:MAG: TetR/AcrR family transcriptional regulator [Cereibacter sphaeroides]|uniref:TetR/AcrR family transcriptional regulator n=1 Tax=Cereibacter sphaeroides TaxID=1063 RepID=A0A2W5U0Z2_CERSP|nr:MAG: TetR/AcrR family transcriptional regulator [Cereibacter sphaeroides]